MLGLNLRNWLNLYVIEYKSVIDNLGLPRQALGGIKNSGKSHDVLDNKGREHGLFD